MVLFLLVAAVVIVSLGYALDLAGRGGTKPSVPPADTAAPR